MNGIPARGFSHSPRLWRSRAATLLAAVLVFGGTGAGAAEGGIRFNCSPARLATIQADMAAYLAELGIAPALVDRRRE
ncbi:MAG TPA: hypothetical protein VJ572_03470, partial [Azonexus sp.]|nr:hypothetical protein [Azonexus sp.]